ncbi:hypothetical protein [Congregibacter litoralis]|uniref:Uncharacterized protein n=1 Tax=Congregibacter litoralis KT71 TaxID=314285 RepID=A4ADI3_9GAMM|nr:hypothetical protein [Congregibacter litoralis]EAQ95981.1 hypothetical protein KT71_18297 [Congregibacter litoralis KT71]
MNYRPTPNLLILDATGDIQRCFRLLRSRPEFPRPPAVNYENLKSVHLVVPKSLQGIRWNKSNITEAKAYEEFMRKAVLDGTGPGDRVLVVYPLTMATTHQVIPKPAESTEEDGSFDWEKRRVYFAHWGPGAGSNQWKGCKHVFLFSEFLKPKRVIIAKASAYSETRASDAKLEGMHGRGMTGDALTVQQGELLMYGKQMACRGNVRNIDKNGVCGEMTIHATMEYGPMLAHWGELFRGAPLPVRKSYDDTESDTFKGRIQRYLAAPDSPQQASSTEVAIAVGCKADQLRRAMATKAVSPYLGAYGWQLLRAREIGLAGNKLYLVRDTAEERKAA